MADRKFSAVISIGAELGASFRTTFGGLGGKIKEVSSSLKGLNDQQRGISGYAKSLQAVNDARARMAEAGKKIADLRSQTRFVEDAEGMAQLNNEIAIAKVNYDKTRVALTKKTEALDKERAALKAAGIDTSKLSTEMERLGREAAQATAKLTALGKIKGTTAELGASMRKLASEAAAAGVALGAVGFAGWKVVKGFADMADEASETGAALGMTAKELLGLRYAGERVGVEAEKMDAALNKFNQKLADAQNGSADAAKAFDELGLDAEMLAAMSGTQRMEALAEAFRNVRDPLDRTRLATDLFGAKAYKMANVMGLGADGLRELRKEAQKTGYIPSEDLIKRAEDFDNAFGAFKATLVGIRNEIGGALLPLVNRFLNFFTEHTLLLKAAIAGFAVVLTGTAIVAVAKLGLTAVTTVKQLGTLITAMRALGALEAINQASGLSGLMNAAKATFPWLTKLATAAIPAVGMAISNAGLAVAGFFSTLTVGSALATGGITLLVAGIALLIVKYWEPIKAFFSGFFSGISEGFREAFGDTMSVIRPVVDFLASAFKPAIDGIGSALSWLVTPLKQTNEQLTRVEGVGKTIGKALMDFLLLPLKLIVAQVKLVQWALSKIGIGSAKTEDPNQPEQPQGGASAPKPIGRDLRSALEPVSSVNNSTQPDGMQATPPRPRLPSVPMASATRNSKTTTNNNTITVQASPGMDEKKLADEVMRRLREQEQQNERAALYDAVPAY